MTFKVALQLGNAPVREALPAIRESAIQLELKRLVIPDGLRETIWLSVWCVDFFIGGRVDAGLRKADALAGSRIKVVNRGRAALGTACWNRCAGRVNKRHQINGGIEFRAYVTDKIHLTHTRKRCLWGYRCRVFNNAFCAAIYVSCGEGKVLR